MKTDLDARKLLGFNIVGISPEFLMTKIDDYHFASYLFHKNYKMVLVAVRHDV